MRSKLSRWLLPAGLAAAALLGTVETSSAQPNVRDHRRGGPPVRDTGPREAPPAVRVEQHEASRAGFVWVSGHWDCQNGRWDWGSGHWERERAKKRWRDVRWEARGGVWVRIDGDWIDDARTVVVVRPTVAPPPIREERIVVKPGYVWIRGHWDWQNGQYAWVGGRYEAVRTGKRWREPRWEQR